MNEKILVFIGGFIFAVVTARKAYAPNRDEQLGSTPPQPKISFFSKCPEGQKMEPAIKCQAMTPQCMNAPDFVCVDDNGCPEGQVKKPVFGRMYGARPSQEQEARDRIRLEEAQRNAPCISMLEAMEIRKERENSPIPS